MRMDIGFKDFTVQGIPAHAATAARVSWAACTVDATIIGLWGTPATCARSQPYGLLSATLTTGTVCLAQHIQLDSFRVRLLPMMGRAPTPGPSMLSPDPVLCGSIFMSTCSSSLEHSCPNPCSSSVEFIRLLRVSFFNTTDHPGMALSFTKNTCPRDGK